ncbi:MAG: hemolysin family protein [Chloroflexi bacterium]|nr:hemolysin family protein [Chloroflexota bacterium]
MMANILLILVLIALNGFFVSVEFAAVSSRRSRLELMGEDKSHAYQIVHGWLENNATRDRLIAATQLGITLVSLALGAVGENTFQAWLEPVFERMVMPSWLAFLEAIIPAMPLILSLIIVTGLHVVLGEQVPKVAVLRKPEVFALRAAPVMDVFGKVFKGFINILDWATRLILGLIGLPPDTSHTTVYSLEEIKQMVSGPEVEGVMKDQEREMISAVIDFGELLVRQVLIPRTEIVAVEADTPVPEVIKLAVENAHTKLPVYEDSLDQIIGIVHLQDLVLREADNESDGRVARDVMREALFVPETISVNKLLHQFKVRKKHIAIVLDEYGGTSGVVTLEDLVEEIIGVIDDPFETSPPAVQNLPDGSFLIDGLSLIEDVNNNFSLKLQNEDYDTIAGFVLGKLGRIAKIGDIVEETDENIRLCVEEMDGMRIARLKLSFIPQTALHQADEAAKTAVQKPVF